MTQVATGMKNESASTLMQTFIDGAELAREKNVA